MEDGAWQISPDFELDLSQPRIMAILNVTPDSFSDGGRLSSPGLVTEAAACAVADGADVLDVGGESTRPGSAPVSERDQIARVIPAIKAIRDAGIAAPISIDSTRAAVARAALDAGADAINDVSGGMDDEGMLPLAAEFRCGLILMHRLRAPADDRYSDRYSTHESPSYDNVVNNVHDALASRLDAATLAGVSPGAIVMDPGLGFGKTVEQNLALIRGTPVLRELGRPILCGTSRKSFVGRIAAPDGAAPAPPADRDPASIVFALRHLEAGARLFRVHDVRSHAEAFRVHRALGDAD
ncbi:MAG: dihydropteroate synthase [Planctomycetota bacterium]